MLTGKFNLLIIYILLGGAVAFLVATLYNWIAADLVRPIPMAIFIGVLLAFIFWVLQNIQKKKKC